MVSLRLGSVCLIAPLLLSQSLLAFTPRPMQDETTASYKERVNRIRQLGKSDPEAIPQLAPYLSDPDRDIRVEAVKAIVRLDTERSLDPHQSHLGQRS